MDRQQANEILARYNRDEASKEEKAKLDNWYARENLRQMQNPEPEDYKRISEEIFALLAQYPEQLEQLTQQPQTRKLNVFYKCLSAAAAVAAIAFGIWFFSASRHSNSGQDATLAKYANDIAPGKNTATITLANGKTIALSSAKTGVVIDATKLVYNDGTAIGASRDSEQDQAMSRVQTITTPRGGTYQITLSDGTKVWLNAASSLTYTAALNERGQRKVKLEGEAYFEVAKDKAHPFIVESNGQYVKVLGTHFNINSYSDEPVTKTTLIEGSVQVNNALLKPNQQAILSGNTIKIEQANLEEEMAWKNGDFLFDGVDFRAAMRKVARWYDVEIVYDPLAPQQVKLGGWVSRSKNISAVLKVMESTGEVHFKVEGRRILVKK